MTRTLSVEIEKRFPRGPLIRGRFVHPLDRFSVTALVGPSGCGKTTVLRCVAGLERPGSGNIRFDGEVWFDVPGGVNLTPQRRGIGYLFQEYALFPHLTVGENITFGLSKLPSAARCGRVAELLRMFQLEGLERRFPREISGGQQQRVALARTVAPQPRLLLLDEPLSALDAPTRTQLRGELKRLLSELRIPTVLVTHDPDEVTALADQVVTMPAGDVVGSGEVR